MSDIAYRVTGPAAPTDDPRRFWHLTVTLARMDWKVRFYGSVLGYVWSLLRPLLLFGILYLVFTQIIRIGSDQVDHYPVLLLLQPRPLRASSRRRTADRRCPRSSPRRASSARPSSRAS